MFNCSAYNYAQNFQFLTNFANFFKMSFYSNYYKQQTDEGIISFHCFTNILWLIENQMDDFKRERRK